MLNNTTVFPTGMILLFLVPYASFSHTLSALNYAMHGRGMTREHIPPQQMDSAR